MTDLKSEDDVSQLLEAVDVPHPRRQELVTLASAVLTGILSNQGTKVNISTATDFAIRIAIRTSLKLDSSLRQ